MGYSVTSTSCLLALGVPPALSSTCVHTSEVVNRLMAGISHFRYGNVDSALFKKLAMSGMVGAVCGAFVVTSLPAEILKPCIASFLLLMGLRILLMGAAVTTGKPRSTRLIPLGLVGGFADVIGGGGWGPIVAANLMIKGNAGRVVVGSVNFAKFFVSVAESASLLLLLKSPRWDIISAMIIGGTIAAPLGASFCSKLPPRLLMKLVGTLICVLSLRTLYRSLS